MVPIRSRLSFIEYMMENHPTLVFTAPYEYLSMKDAEMNKMIKTRLMGQFSINPSRIHEYLSYSQKEQMERLIKQNIVQRDEILQEGGFVFNVSPGIIKKDEEDNFNMRFEPVFTNLIKSKPREISNQIQTTCLSTPRGSCR